MGYYPRLVGVWYSPDAIEYWSNTTVTAQDLYLANQPIQERRLRIRVMDKGYGGFRYIIEGKMISFNISIDADSPTRRTATLTMALHPDDELDWRDTALYDTLMLEEGCKDFRTGEYVWYQRGYFVVTTYDLSCTVTEKTISLNLSDYMAVIDGTRDGVIAGFEPQIKVTDYSPEAVVEYERLQGQLAIAQYKNDKILAETIKNRMSSLKVAWINNYLIMDVMNDITRQFYHRDSGYTYSWDFCPITNDWGMKNILDNKLNTKEDLDQFCVPYDIQFPTGVTLYEVLEKLVHLYPAYEMFWDVYKCLKVRREPSLDVEWTLNRSANFMVENDWNGLIISEDVNRDFTQMFNSCTVWGKDGLYRGDAEWKGSLYYYAVNELGRVHKEFAGENYDNCDSDHTCEGWARYLVNKSVRYNDSVTLTLKNCIFFNEVNYKVKVPSIFGDTELSRKYRHRTDDAVAAWFGFNNTTYTGIIKKISSDFEQGTTTVTLIKADDLSDTTYSTANYIQLDTPIIENTTVDGRNLVVSCQEIQYAENYQLYCDGRIIATATHPVFIHTFTEEELGEHLIWIKATSDNFIASKPSEQVVINIEEYRDCITTSDGVIITSSDNEPIMYN